jgi:hypothetical protein
MEPREDDIMEFLLEKDENTKSTRFSKFSLLIDEDIRYTKSHIVYTKADNSIGTKSLYYTDMGKWNLTAFFDAFVMAYFPNISKRYKNRFGQDELLDVYGNTITIYSTDTITIDITGAGGAARPKEVEHLYDRLIFEIIKKVRTYGEDMEIGR